ncbi:MAG: phospholipase D-like domain-containing protein, partial [Verrucomicrobiota bacterium]
MTNETGKKLKDRLDALLKNNTKLFDCLVGYFYVTGFFKICESLKETETIRILVGISTNRQTYDLLQTAKQSEFDLSSHSQTKKLLPSAILEEMEKSEDSSEIEQGVLKFIEWLKTGKLEVRAYPSEKIHAKLYIMTFAEGDRDLGRVITGSSNLTQAGLQHNLEFNVELKNPADYKFALNQFNDLWKHSVDVCEVYIDTIQRKSPYAQFSPYELYLKFLYEYFRGELNRPEELEDLYLPTGFKKLKYQEEAVLSAKRVLDEYGGVFISDVVGLGKTYISAMLARELSGRSLVIAPPALLDKSNPGSWPNVFSDFRAPQTDFESVGKLDDLQKRDTGKYSNIFLDESHRFRTETNQTYEKLAQICRGKRIILVSATPLNNRPKDILSQIKLFQPGKNSSIPNVKDLESFFGKMEKRLKGLDRKKDRDAYFSAVRQNASETRDKILKYLMIRRTRGEIEKYYGTDLKEQKLKFPDVCDPDALFYRFGPVENEVFNQTIHNVINGLSFARYKPFMYYEGPLTDFEKQGQVNLAKFMMILLVKRLESSFHAFRLTLDRFIRSHEHVIEQHKQGHVFLSKKHIGKIFEYLEAGDEEAIQALIDDDKADRLNADDFSPDFITDLEHDLKLLREIREQWKRIKRDPKWVEFQDALTTKAELTKEKLIIFT